jgi:hypothetical protein
MPLDQTRGDSTGTPKHPKPGHRLPPDPAWYGSPRAHIERILAAFSPSLENAAAFLGSLAQWCDIGYGDATMVRRLLATYDHESRCRLSILRVCARSYGGGHGRHDGGAMLDSAIEHFDVVLKIAGETRAWEVLAIANYWKARCQRKKGQYESALSHVKQALGDPGGSWSCAERGASPGAGEPHLVRKGRFPAGAQEAAGRGIHLDQDGRLLHSWKHSIHVWANLAARGAVRTSDRTLQPTPSIIFERASRCRATWRARLSTCPSREFTWPAIFGAISKCLATRALKDRPEQARPGGLGQGIIKFLCRDS